MKTIIETAIFANLQFPSSKGALNLQDVASLPLTSTNPKTLTLTQLVYDAASKITTQESSLTAFMEEKPVVDTLDDLRYKVLRRFYEIKKAEKAALVNEQEFKKQLQEIEAQIADRKASAFKELPLEELEARRQALLASKA